MMQSEPADNLADGPAAGLSSHRRIGPRLPAALAVAAAMALTVLLAVRPLTSPDLGYHLAYGETFLDTGRIVDHNDFLFTLSEGEPRPEPGPGCWYDDAGRYRFPNANWLSQIVMAAVNRWAGADGLCILQAALVAGIFLLVLTTMRRLGVPWSLAAGGLLLAAMTAYMRFNLRPEVFGYLLLVAQLRLLLSRWLGWRHIAAIIILQVLLVNLHSYFLLPMALTGAMLVEALLHAKWPPAGGDRKATRRRTICLTVILGGQLMACLCNPWTWRLAVLPIQTLMFLRANDIAAGTGSADHPWSLIGEFYRPFAGGFVDAKSTYAFCLVLALAATGAIACLLRRRWGWLLVIAGMTAVSLSMRRNIALGAILIVPLALAACWTVLGTWWMRWPRHKAIGMIGSGAIALLSVGLCLAVLTQRFYFAERSPARFGWGLSRLHLPLEAAEALDGEEQPARIWTGYNISSNLHYFAEPHPPVPILTNTWAYPPSVMGEVLDYCAGRRPFAEAERRYEISAVVLQPGYATSPLIAHLAADPDWSVTSVAPRYVVFRKEPSQSEVITPEMLDVPARIVAWAKLDAVPASSLHWGGLTLYQLGWLEQAAEVFAAAVEQDANYYEAWSMRGVCLATLGQDLMRDTGNPRLLKEAAECFRRALAIRPDYEPARTNLARIEQQLR